MITAVCAARFNHLPRKRHRQCRSADLFQPSRAASTPSFRNWQLLVATLAAPALTARNVRLISLRQSDSFETVNGREEAVSYSSTARK